MPGDSEPELHEGFWIWLGGFKVLDLARRIQSGYALKILCMRRCKLFGPLLSNEVHGVNGSMTSACGIGGNLSHSAGAQLKDLRAVMLPQPVLG